MELFHKDKQGGGVYDVELRQEAALANLDKSSHSTGNILVGADSYGEHFLYTMSIFTLKVLLLPWDQGTGPCHGPTCVKQFIFHTSLCWLPTAWYVVGLQSVFGGGRAREREDIDPL